MPNPGRDREAERLQHQRRRLRHHAVAEEPDAPFLGPDDPRPAPLPIGLSRLIAGHVAMKAQNMHDDVFRHHRIAARRLDLAERDLRQLWMIDKGFDAGRAAEHRFQIRKAGSASKSGCMKARYSISANSPASGQMRISRSGSCAANVSRHACGVADMFVEINDKQRHNRPRAIRSLS